MALSQAEQQIADELLSHSLDLYRLDAHLRSQALEILERMQKELAQRLLVGTLTEVGRERINAILEAAKRTIESYYQQVQAEASAALAQLPEVQAQVVRAALVGIGYESALPPLTHIATAMTDVMIHGAPSSEWWKRQASDTVFRFSNAVRQGIIQGETNQQIIRKIAGGRGVTGVLEVSRKNAATLVQTSVQTVANAARLESFKQNAPVVNGLKQLSTLDSHTTDICMAYSGMEWDLEGKPINGNKLPFVNPTGSPSGTPRHWNCRSILVPKTVSFAELGIDVSELKKTTRASVDGQIAADTTFDAFLKRKGKAFQDEILGPGRADLWRSKKITLQQLLDLRGNPLTLAELREKYL